MNVKLGHRFTPDVDVLDLLGGDVLALRQLEDVLLPVNDLQRAVLERRGEVKQKDDERRTQVKNLKCITIIMPK